MIYRAYIDFEKLEEGAQSISDLTTKEEKLKLIHKYMERDIYVKAKNMREAISKVNKLVGTDPCLVEESNLLLI